MKTRQIGEVLREEREERGFSLQDFAIRTRIRPEYLESLEANQFEGLPAATFVKGYIKTYARELGFDPDPLIGLLRRDYKESAKGKLVPREFIKPVLKKQRSITNVTVVMVLMASIFVTLIGYVGVQWYNLQKPPRLTLSTPSESQVVSGEVQVRGTTTSESFVTVNAQPVALQSDGSFSTTVSFETEGVSTVMVEATDRRGKSNRQQVTVYVQF
jgi:cytoskeletal protein RodZ